jgi:hypothetical protein
MSTPDGVKRELDEVHAALVRLINRAQRLLGAHALPRAWVELRGDLVARGIGERSAALLAAAVIQLARRRSEAPRP